MTVRLSLRDVTVRRGTQTVLDVPRLDVAAGGVVAVIGPNGAGKSTLLLMLALLERPSSGAVLFDGQPVRGRERAWRQRMAVVFQEPLLLDRSVRENVLLGLRLRRVPGPVRGRRADEWLDRLGIATLADRRAHALSGGEAQRTSLARAFALEPELLLLDEPFSGLDAPTRRALVTDLGRLVRRPGLTTVLVTHDRDEALQLADRAVVLIGGRIRQEGAIEDVFSRPADPEVAAFVGVETVVRGQVVSWDGGLATIGVGDALVVAVSEPVDTTDVLVCVRPEDVTLAPLSAGEGMSSARNHLPSRVVELAPAGGQCRVTLDAGFPLVALITRRSADELGLIPGTPAVASFKASSVHVIPTG